MAKYQAPEGYVLDPGTGLFYTQVIAEDESGNKSQVVTWFNADTGEYRQDVYPIQGGANTAPPVSNSGLLPAPPEPEIRLSNGKSVASVRENNGRITVSKVAKPASPKKKSKTLLIAIASILAIAAIVCGFIFKDKLFGKNSGGNGGNEELSSSEDNNSDSGDISGKITDDIFEIHVASDTEAFFVFHAEKTGIEKIRVVEFDLDDFKIILADYEQDHSSFTCHILKNGQTYSDGSTELIYLRDAEYYVCGTDIIIRANAFVSEAFDYKYPFNDCAFSYNCYDDSGEYYTFTWDDYAIDGSYPLDGAVQNGLGSNSQSYDDSSYDEYPEQIADVYDSELYSNDDFYIGTYICGDFDIIRADAPVIVFNDDDSFELWAFLDDGSHRSFWGKYYVERGNDGLTCVMEFANSDGIVPDEAYACFDYADRNTCLFVSEGFGNMGSGEVPYMFYRDTRN